MKKTNNQKSGAIANGAAVGPEKAPDDLAPANHSATSGVNAPDQNRRRAIERSRRPSSGWRLYVRSRDHGQPNPRAYVLNGREIDKSTRSRELDLPQAMALMARITSGGNA